MKNSYYILTKMFINVLYYDRIDVFEGTDIHKTSASKEYDICHHWCFLPKGSTFQLGLCNECHDVLIMPIKILVFCTFKVLIIVL